MKPIFIIEHLEKRVFKWCLIEYGHISKIVGKKNLWFTNIKRSRIISRYGKIINKSVVDLGLDLDKVCVLDPETKKTLSPLDGKKFKYFVFGGILGDYPPKKRTRKELTRFLPGAGVRNIGKKQMSTDNAVFVVNSILNGKKISQMEFLDKLEIKLNKVESVDLPYRYALHNGQPVFSPELLAYLKRKKGF